MFTVGRTTTYTFLATEDVLSGPLGKIETSSTGCTTKFRTGRFWFWNVITVDHKTGIVRLNTRFHLGSQKKNFRNLTANVLVTTTCGYSQSNYDVTVNLIVFREKFGDSFLSSSIRKWRSLVKENEKYNTGRGMAGSLHRMMRMVEKEKNRKAFDEMMASAKVDTALQEAINEIVAQYIPKISGSYSIHHLIQ